MKYVSDNVHHISLKEAAAHFFLSSQLFFKALPRAFWYFF